MTAQPTVAPGSHVLRHAPNWLIAAALYLLLTLVVTYPSIFQLNSYLIGDNSDSADVRESVWSVWWWGRSLSWPPHNPLNLTTLNHPDSLSFPLFPLMAQPFVLGALLSAAISPVLAYNLLVLVSFVSCGLAGYWLCADLSGDARAGFVGGLIWAFFPARIAHVVAGHLPLIFVAGLPLAAFALRRLLLQPTPRRAGLTALGLLAGATIHPIYLPYGLAPLVAGLTAEAFVREGRAFWQRPRVSALALAFGVFGLAALCLAGPALAEWAGGRAVFSNPTADVIGRSPDLLAYLVPSSDHPLLQTGPLHDWAVRIVPYQYEQLTYVGWVVLGLAILGARSRPGESRLWVVLVVLAAVLALGPLLKLGGDFARVSVAGEQFRLVLPYAFLADLPVLQWSRTPGRLTFLLMLALAVLAAFGVRHLLQQRVLAARPLTVVGTLTAVILFEYLVRWPFPTFPATPPVPLAALRAQPDGLAVLQLPTETYAQNQQALFWQTVHGQPLVGGRVYRDAPEASRTATFFRELVVGRETAGLTPARSREARLSVLHAARLGWVLYDKAADPAATLRPVLVAALGAAITEDEQAALFRVPPAAPAPEPVWEIGPGWEDRAGPRRFCHQGVVYVYTFAGERVALAFTATPATATRFSLRLNEQLAGRYVASHPGQYATEALSLRPGLNVVTFESQGPLANTEACRTATGQASAWGPVIGEVQLLEPAATPPSGAIFGGAVRVLAIERPPEIETGAPLALRVVWQALGVVGEDWTVFVHLLDETGRLVAQHDSPPLAGAYPTSAWVTGEVIADAFTLTLPPTALPGRYELRLGFYRSASLERIPIAGAPNTDQAALLGDVLLRP